MKFSLSTALCLALACGVSAAQAANDDSPAQRAAKLVAEVCSACHRPQGQSSPALVPTLAGQHRAYLAWQMRAYQRGFRDDPQAHDRMWDQANKLDEPLLDALAAYYASQPPPRGTPGDAALIARGKALYERGLPSSHVTDCADCHGQHAEGRGVFPRLAGQRADYLTREMALIQLQLRNVGIMHSTVQGLSDNDIAALAAYLQSI